MDNISAHITYDEAVKSQTGIRLGLKNDPSIKELAAMKLVANKVFEPIRNYFGKSIGISSFYRGPALNKAIGGASSSQHCKGEAIDIDADIYGQGITNTQIFNYVKANLNFDQMIAEFSTGNQPSWVHVSYSSAHNRKEILIAEKVGGRTVYHPYSEQLYKRIYG